MRIVYIALMIALGFFYVLYSDDLSFVMLISAAVLPFLLFAELWYVSRRVTVTAKAADAPVKKGGETEITLTLTNPTFFPMPINMLKVLCTRYPTGEKNERTVVIPVPARSSEKISVTVSSEYCQRVECRIEQIRIYDLLHMFSLGCSRRTKISASVDFLPSGQLVLPAKYAGRLSIPSGVAGQADMTRGDRTPFEFDELREYRDGDKPNRIAWKLSGRGEELIVRDAGMNTRTSILLAADIASAADAGSADCIYEGFYTAAQMLCEHEMMFDSAASDGSFVTDITLSDRFDEAVRGIYGEPFPMDRFSNNDLNRRYDVIFLVTLRDSDDELSELKKRFCAREVVRIVPMDAAAA